jgi:PAS domain S-box-containing protein
LLFAKENKPLKNRIEDYAAGPLMCWDLFMESHHRRLLQADGLIGLRQLARNHQWRIDWDLPRLLLAEERVVLVTDTAQVIRFATPNMAAMNGYEVEEVIGKSPRIFQGKDSDPETRSQIRDAIVRRIPFKGTIINYRKDGAPYNCLVEEYPVWNKGGSLVHFIAFEKIA